VPARSHIRRSNGNEGILHKKDSQNSLKRLRFPSSLIGSPARNSAIPASQIKTASMPRFCIHRPKSKFAPLGFNQNASINQDPHSALSISAMLLAIVCAVASSSLLRDFQRLVNSAPEIGVCSDATPLKAAPLGMVSSTCKPSGNFNSGGRMTTPFFTVAVMLTSQCRLGFRCKASKRARPNAVGSNFVAYNDAKTFSRKRRLAFMLAVTSS
jgi:hypothetical protein